ncbi:hypothetical protein CRG98_018406, partial [Punica granatum]
MSSSLHKIIISSAISYPSLSPLPSPVIASRLPRKPTLQNTALSLSLSQSLSLSGVSSRGCSFLDSGLRRVLGSPRECVTPGGCTWRSTADVSGAVG